MDTKAVQPVATCRQSLAVSLTRYYHCDVILIMTSRAYVWRSQPPFSLWRHSHCDVIRYWAGHAHRYGRTLRTDTLPRLIYRNFYFTSGKRRICWQTERHPFSGLFCRTTW